MKPVVYFTREITPEKVLELYKKAGKDLPGKVAVKLHSGEKGNQNFLGPEFWKPVVEYVGGTVVECNTAYDGERNETRKHKSSWRTTDGADISMLTFSMRKVRTWNLRYRTEK